MRLFIALLFPKQIKDKIYDYQTEVKTLFSEGNFTGFDNLHLTILYLGETNKLMFDKIKQKLKEIVIHQFTYQTGRIDCFKKHKAKKIVYLEVKNNYSLKRLYNQVCIKLKELGLDFPTEKYTPHITLGRQVSILDMQKLYKINAKSLTVKATKISLMESTRINGKLTYIERDYIELK